MDIKAHVVEWQQQFFLMEMAILGRFSAILQKETTLWFNLKLSWTSSLLWLCWGLMTCQPLWVILCSLPEKRDRRENRGDKREEQGRKRNRNESEEREEIKTIPLYPYLLQG